MNPHAIAEWKDFFIAVSGAAAAFAGLLFVGLSINLARIIALPGISGRAGEALILLGSALTSALLGLVPQLPAAFGWELLCVGSVVWCVVTSLHIGALRRLHFDTISHGIQRVILAQAATLPMLIGPALFLFRDSGSLFWLVPGLVLPLIVSMFSAWVLLVEIMR
jgi:hypothetical protein